MRTESITDAREPHGGSLRGNRRVVRGMIIALLVVPLAAFSLLFAFANTSRNTAPEVVSRVVPFDAAAPVAVAERRLMTEPDKMTAAELRQTALHSLEGQAVNAPAFRLLTFAAAMDRRDDEAARFARLSESMSRRELLTQFWLIERAVQGGDHKGALSHYDKALRTNLNAYQALFPVLLQAISDDQIRAELIPYIERNPRWVVSFLLEATGSDATAIDSARLLIEAGSRVNNRVSQTVGPQLTARLVNLGEYALADRYFSAQPGAPRTIMQASGLSAATTDPRWIPFTWHRVGEGTTLGAAIEAAGDDRRTLRVYAGPGDRGPTLRKWFRLAPGSYRFTERRRVEIADPGAGAYWELSCHAGKQATIVWRSPNGTASEIRNAPGPVIPTGCTHQSLDLIAAGGQGQQGLDVVIEDFRLTR